MLLTKKANWRKKEARCMCEGNNVEQTETIGPLIEKQTICIIRARMFSRLGMKAVQGGAPEDMGLRIHTT